MSEIFRKIAQQVLKSQAFQNSLENMLTEQIENAIKSEAAGDRFYVAQQSREAIKARNKLIVAQFNGRNLSELAKRFNIKERQVRNILARG